MKYRIKERINNKGESTFTPEFRKYFVWDDFSMTFHSFNQAEKYIHDMRKKDTKKVKYHKIK